jgi:CheY-like chemotaxis protein/anti-sigma regulatory factor (Ser/Thr protein kinase)
MKRILVADDDSETRKSLSKILRDENFAVSTAGNGRAALNKLRKMHFDLALLDVWMPQMSGLDVLKALHGKKSLPKLLVITPEDGQSGAMHQHAYQYVSKPVDREVLIKLVRQYLEKKTSVPPIEVLSARPEWVELLVPCSLEAAGLLEAFMTQLNIGLRDEVRASVGQAFHELLMNAIEWGGKLNPKRRVRVSCLRGKRMLLYRIADPGSGFKFAGLNHAAVTHTGEPTRHGRIRERKGLRPGGFGLVLVKANADELLYNDAQNEVVFVKYLD